MHGIVIFAGMKSLPMKSLILASFILTALAGYGQQPFTPYDDIPGILKSYKPAYDPAYPEWARMLYKFPVNFHEITRAYREDIQRDAGLGAINRYFILWSRCVEPFTLDDGTIRLPDPESRAVKQSATRLSAKDKGSQYLTWDSDWSFLGPKETFWLNETGSPQIPKACPWQVNVYAFDVAPSDPFTLYAGTETGYVNKSTDKGLTWQILALDYYFGGAVTAVAIHPFNPDVVYVAAGNQVHLTTDGGNNWTPLLLAGSLFHADRLKIDPADPAKILAAANEGVHVSTDGGQSWQNTWNGPAYDVEFRPGNSSYAYALTKTGGNFAVVESTDGGMTFSIQPGFPPNIADVSGGLLAMTPANPDLLLAVMLSSGNTPYLYKTILGTGSWSLLATGQTGVFPMNNGQGYFDLVLEISPLNPDIVFAGTTTLYRSLNGGQNFTAIGGYAGAFPIHPDIQDMKLLPNGETWVSTDGGFTLTTDNFGSTLNAQARNNGLVGSDLWGFDQGWNEDLLVGGRYHNGNTALADFYGPKALRMGGAESPTGWVLQGKSRHVAFNDLGNGWILPQQAEGKPEGRFIFSKYPNMEEYGGRRGNMVFHPNYYGEITLGEGNGIWKSFDMGVTWELLYNFNAQVRYLQISLHNPEVLYADVVSLGLCRSDDGGQTWVAKPSLTSGQYGNAYWKGKLFFAISPVDENIIYACLQNGTWSADIGKVFRSADGGGTWEDWTGSVLEYLKCMVIQPTGAGEELVYLFTNARNGHAARVFVRSTGMTDWEPFENNYPAGMSVNMAFPFFRNGKLRSGGNAGVWESPLAVQESHPIINPWVEKSFYNCMTDTLFFEDHSILNHAGASWHWEINPAPAYISDADIRNPKVVLGNPGTYSVTMSVTKNGEVFSKTIPDMITATTCPSIYDCSNPAEVPKEIWELLYVDSEELNYPGLATMAFDDDPETIWHTRWSTGSDPYPHEIQVDMGQVYQVQRFIYLNRQDGENGRIQDYELYLTEDTLDWGSPVLAGQFVNTAAPQTLFFEPQPKARYWRLVALTEVNGNPWASAAEFSVVGCIDLSTNSQRAPAAATVAAFPVPAEGWVTLPLPPGRKFNFSILSSSGQLVEQGTLDTPDVSARFDLGDRNPGMYIIRITDEQGRIYTARVIRE